MTGDRLGALLAAAAQSQRRATAVAIIAGVAATVSAVLLLGLSGWFIAGSAVAGAAGIVAVQAFNYLLPSAAIRLLAIVRTVSRYGERLIGHRAALLALARFRTALFAALIANRAPATFALGAGDAAARLGQDVDTLEETFVRKPALPAALAAAAVGVGLAATAGWAAALALLLVLSAVAVLAAARAPGLFDWATRELQASGGALKQDFVDYAAASAENVAYALDAPIRASLEIHAVAIDSARRDLARGDALLGALLVLAGGIAMALVLWLSTASLPWTVLAALAAGGAVEALAAHVRSIGRAALVTGSMARLAALVADVPEAGTRHDLSGAQLVLPDGGDSITLVHGDRLAIHGASGSGKTSLLERLAGLRPDTTGRLRIDGVAVADCTIDDLRDVFALSPQNAQMISGTIADNLRLARPGLTDADLWAALAVACLDGDVRAMPDGLDAWVGDGGTWLSGGQRKRLSVARALLAGRPWLLLDEPSEGLDPATEQLLVARLGAWIETAGCGLIVVSHRPAMWALAPRRFEMALT